MGGSRVPPLVGLQLVAVLRSLWVVAWGEGGPATWGCGRGAVGLR